MPETGSKSEAKCNQDCGEQKLRVCFENGAPVANNSDIMTAGPWGPTLLEDVWHLEKMGHFNREVLPERRMHAKGGGAYGVFKVTHDITKYTKAKLFSSIGKEVEIVARFSTAGGEKGAADAERDIRGFAVRFYTEEGNWDLVGNNTPIFFFRDPMRFPDFSHILHRNPKTNLRTEDMKWEFWSQLPEALHQVTITMSDRGIPKSFRHMHGFGSHAFSMINNSGVRTWVKFHWVCQQPIENLTDDEAEKVIGKDRDSNVADLYYSIERKEFPKWKLFIQTMTEEQALKMPFNPFDLTKVWSKKQFPLQEVGEMTLNRNPANQFAEMECVAFKPANVVPGISFSPDKMLQSRLFGYGDAARYRLGVNHSLLPVNKPRCPFSAFHRDGIGRTDGNLGPAPYFFPNDQGQWEDHHEKMNPPERLFPGKELGERQGDPTNVFAYHWKQNEDHFEQPKALFLLLTDEKRQLLARNTARSLSQASELSQQRHIKNCTLAHEQYGKIIAQALKDYKEGKFK